MYTAAPWQILEALSVWYLECNTGGGLILRGLDGTTMPRDALLAGIPGIDTANLVCLLPNHVTPSIRFSRFEAQYSARTSARRSSHDGDEECEGAVSVPSCSSVCAVVQYVQTDFWGKNIY